MQLIDHLKLIRRKWKTITLITIITLGSSLVSAYYYFQGYNSTIFLSIGLKQNLTVSPYDNLQAADQFTETIQGWFKNQQLIKSIEDQSQIRPEFSVRKQEKQNLVVSYKTTTSEQAQKLATSTKDVLQKNLLAYNQANNTEYNLSVFNNSTEKSTYNPITITIIGLIFGFIVGVFIAYCYEYIFYLGKKA